MNTVKTKAITYLVIPACLLLSGAAHSQQASFAVAVTLHSASVPDAARQLCPQGKPTGYLASGIVRIDCPAIAKPAEAQRDAATTLSSTVTAKNEVLVSF